jgi:hypothetical protein
MGNHPYDSLTKYLKQLDDNSFGEWVIDRENDGSPEHPKQMPFVDYSAVARPFAEDVYRFVDGNSHLGLSRYSDILAKNHIRCDFESMANADVSAMDAQCVLALIVGAVRAERFCDGALLDFFENGCMAKWLKRLNEIRES